MSVYMFVCVFMHISCVCVYMYVCIYIYIYIYNLQMVLPKLICERAHLVDLKASVFKNWAF